MTKADLVEGNDHCTTMSSSDMPSFSQEQVKKWLYILSAGLIALSCILGLATLIQKGNSDTRVDWIFGLVS